MTLNDLVVEYGSPYAFYRAVYTGTVCGPTIGMLFEQMDGWVYCSDLPGQMDDLTIRAISVSSIVEGSDVEIEPIIVTDPGEVLGSGGGGQRTGVVLLEEGQHDQP